MSSMLFQQKREQSMNYISIIGLLILLSGAWLMSFHKTEVKIRPIIWGIGLQLIFALIILREDYMSFIGMSLLGLLIITYIHQKDNEKLGGGIKSAIIIVIISSIIGYLLINFLSFANLFTNSHLISAFYLIYGSSNIVTYFDNDS